ncbi:MAG: YadA-like family protein, partial [Acinetobacter sp.]|uniref:YadA-like family protein n=1 Tax=Acinetobacter sp. TaxID=472 RepID=UPI0026E005A1
VNGSQLNQAQTNVSNILGGNATNTAGNITMTDIGGTGTNTVHDAIQAVNTQANSPLTFAGDSGTKVERKLGTTVNVKGGAAGNLTDGNIGVVADGKDTLTVKLAEAIDLGNNGSVTIGNTVVNNAGLTINGGPSVTASGIHAGNKQITNVASGGNINDAANANNAANISDVKTAAAAAKTTVSAGSNVVVTKTTDATTGADNYQVATAADVNFDKVTVGNVVVDKTTNKITGIEAGTETKDAVNKGQLDALATQQATADALNVKYDSTAKDKVTLGGAGSTTPVQVSNVKAGDLSATSTDAVNGSQLYATNQNVATNSNNITNLQNQTFKLQANGDTASAVKASDTVQFLNGDNINISRNGNNITVATAKTVAFDKVTVGNVVVDKTTSKITGLTAGTDDLDAVNVSQLKAVQAVATTTDNFAVKYDQNTDGSVNKDSVTLTGTTATATKDANTGNITTTGGTSIKNVASAGDYKDLANANKAVNAGDLNNAVLDASNNVKNILGGATTVAADGSINNSNIGGTGQSTIHDAIAAVNNAAVQAKNTVTAGENITVTASKNADGSNNYQVATKKDVNFDSVKVGDVSVSAAGIQAGNQKVTNVADGAINASSKDAVNGSQLNNTNQKVVEYLGGGAGYDNITQSFNNPTYTVGHGSTAQQYNNVGGAIDALNQADAALDNRITNLGDQLQQAFYSTNERIDTVEKRANAGIAAAMALENAPYIPGKYTYAAGAAYHGGENAIGLTLRKTADNGRWSLTGGVAAGSQGDPSVRIGISGVID